ncbi:MAG: VWA domain-containing protein [Vicinamibacteria bacterium]
MSGLESFPASAAAWLSEIAVRATVVLVAAVALVQTLRNASAALRHAVLVLTAGALLALPLASALLPAWQVPVLPRAPEPTAAVVPRLAVSMPASRPVPSAREARLNPHLLKTAAAPAARALPPAPVASPWTVRLAAAAVLVWLTGVALALARLSYGAIAIRRVGRRASLVTDDAWYAVLERCAQELGLPRVPLLLRSSAVTAAVVYGHRRPIVVLAQDAAAWPYDKRRAFLLHELAHARRRDVTTRTLSEVARALYWPHPLAWWLVGRQATEAERACDDRVLGGGIGADDYATYLLEAARSLVALPRPLSVLSVTGRLESRMLAILDPLQRRTTLSGRAWLAGAAAGLACVASAAAIEPAPPEPPRPPRAVSAPRAPRPPHAPRAVDAPRAPQLPPLPPVIAAEPATPSAEVAPPAAAAPALAPAAPSAEFLPVLAPPPPPEAPEPPETPELPAHVAPVLAPPPPPAQAPAASPVPPPPPTVIRISTSLVQLDAVVTDRAGRPVTDLTPADFEVVEGGRRRQVTHVTYVRPGEPRGGTPGRRTIVFLVDDLHLEPRGIVETRDLLSSFARKHLDPTDVVAIVKTSDVAGKGLHFTAGAASVEAAAAGIRYSRVSLARDVLGVAASPNPDRTGEFRQSGRENILPLVSPESDALEASRMASRSVVALKAVVGALRALPGRKAVVFLSQGFVAALPHSADQAGRFRFETFGALDAVYGDATLEAAVRGVSDLANRASVVLYGIDPTGPARVTTAMTTGLGMPDSQAVGAPGTFTSAAIGSRQREARQNGLLDLALPTGGLVWRDTFDHDRHLTRILADQSGYYLVAYEPDAATFARIGGAAPFHDVAVKVRRGGLDVRSRQGFYGVTDEVVAQQAPAM